VIRVRTKADLPQCGTGFQPVGLDRGTGVPPVNRPKADAPTSAALPVCALDRWNLPTLRRAIADAAWGSVSTSPLWVLPRHRRTLASAAEHLRSALASVPPDGTHALTTPELTAAALRSALDALGELAGDISPDDVIGRVFATFCVGK
jgi:tRNA modification GTPase